MRGCSGCLEEENASKDPGCHHSRPPSPAFFSLPPSPPPPSPHPEGMIFNSRGWSTATPPVPYHTTHGPRRGSSCSAMRKGTPAGVHGVRWQPSGGGIRCARLHPRLLKISPPDWGRGAGCHRPRELRLSRPPATSQSPDSPQPLAPQPKPVVDQLLCTRHCLKSLPISEPFPLTHDGVCHRRRMRIRSKPPCQYLGDLGDGIRSVTHRRTIRDLATQPYILTCNPELVHQVGDAGQRIESFGLFVAPHPPVPPRYGCLETLLGASGCPGVRAPRSPSRSRWHGECSRCHPATGSRDRCHLPMFRTECP